MFHDGPTDDTIIATTFQGLTPNNGAPCLSYMLVMQFGLCNAPATFTHLMTHVCVGSVCTLVRHSLS
jgi:hypothetical protein